MKLSELFEETNRNIKYAFILGQIYAWPIISKDNKYILSYNSYKGGKRNKKLLENKSINDYYLEHKNVLKNFLNINEVYLNSELKEKLDFKKTLGPGVSILIEFDYSIEEKFQEKFIYGLIEKWLIDTNEELKKFFLIGIMDGRGSLDFNHKLVSIDIANRDFPELVKRKLNKYNDLIGTFNFNPRLTQKNSNLKNDQFRIPLNLYVGKYGFLSPFKIDYYKLEVPNGDFNMKYGFIFFDKRFENISLLENQISSRNFFINKLAIELKENPNLTLEEKKAIIDKYREENLISDNDDELEYASQNVKETAKIEADYNCEFNCNHRSFIAKSSQKRYVEGHHLIPFSKRNNYELNIDIVENIVSLCPNCHRRIHLAIDEEKIILLDKLFDLKIKGLIDSGIKISKNELYSYYNINI